MCTVKTLAKHWCFHGVYINYCQFLTTGVLLVGHFYTVVDLNVLMLQIEIFKNEVCFQ